MSVGSRTSSITHIRRVVHLGEEESWAFFTPDSTEALGFLLLHDTGTFLHEATAGSKNTGPLVLASWAQALQAADTRSVDLVMSLRTERLFYRLPARRTGYQASWRHAVVVPHPSFLRVYEKAVIMPYESNKKPSGAANRKRMRERQRHRMAEREQMDREARAELAKRRKKR